MRLELRHLTMVCAIADNGSVTKAASTLGLAQPALTAQLQRIERALGGALFERDRRGARPTPLGELVLARARVLLPAVRGLQDEAARVASNGASMPLYRIGAANSPILSGLVHRLTADSPRAHLTTCVSWAGSELADLLATGRLDFALLGVCGDTAPPSDHHLAWQLVAVDAMFVLLPDDHRLAGKDEVDLTDLADARWVTTPDDGCLRDCFVAACVRSGFTPLRLYEGDLRTCVEMVEAGDAVALCQSSFRPYPGLVSVPIAGVPLRWRHLLGWHPDSPTAKESGRIIGYAAAAYRDAVTRLPRVRKWLADHPQFGIPLSIID